MSTAIVLFLTGCQTTNKPHTPSPITSFCNRYKPIDYKDAKRWGKALVEKNESDLQSTKGFIFGFEKNAKHDELYRTQEWQEMKVKLAQHFQNYELHMLLATLNDDIYPRLFYYNEVFQKICKKSSH